MIAGYEALGLRAWPAANEVDIDGWTACLSEGTTRRTNSVQTFATPHGELDLEQRIDACETLYRNSGLRPVFKLSEASQPRELEAVLAGRGYVHADPTSVQDVSLSRRNASPDPDVAVQDAIDDDWYTACLRLNRIPRERTDGLRAGIERMPSPLALASIGHAGKCVAQGVGALSGDRLFLCLVATAADARRQGLGRRVVEGLLDWGAARGAHTAWLQVVAENASAVRLYERLGFVERYRYWYRQPAG